MARLSLLDIAKRNAGDAIVGLIEENLTYAPEAQTFPARTIKGTSYKTLIRTDGPGISFRNANEGVAATKSTYKNMLVECFILDGRIEVDKAVVDAAEDGAAQVLADEASGRMKKVLIGLGSQVWYGVSADAKGFAGCQATVDSSMVQDAGGTTADTGSSVYGVTFGPKDCQFVFGNSTPLRLPEWRLESVTDSGGTNKFTGYVSSIEGWVGFQIGNKYSISRLQDCTEAEAAARVSDTWLGRLLAKYPVGHRPDVWFMNRRSAEQLQRSRTVTSVTVGPGAKSAKGTEIWAPWPTESHGIPVIVTDSIVSTEALS